MLGCEQTEEKQGAKEESGWQGLKQERGRGHGEEGRRIHETVQRPELGRVGTGGMGLQAQLCVTRAGRDP